MLNSTQRLRRCCQYCTALPLLLITHPALAHLPKPPDDWYAKDGNWFEAAQNIGDVAVKTLSTFLGIALICVVISGMIRGYQHAQERQEMSHFFKAIGVGVVCLGLGFALLYGAHFIMQK